LLSLLLRGSKLCFAPGTGGCCLFGLLAHTVLLSPLGFENGP
jgi:hypothetical protein